MAGKKQAQPKERTIRTRRMGASPGGFQQLEETRRSRKQPQPNTQADTGAATSLIQTTSSKDPAAPTLEQPQTPPTTTSRSQSPHLETESDSLSHIPESRSTSPPARNTRSQTRSMSPDTAQQKPKAKGKLKSSGPSKKVAKKLTKKKHTRDEFEACDDEGVAASEKHTAIKEPPAKRSRIEDESYSLEELTPMPKKAAPAVTEDSSADDGTAEIERPPKLSRSRSASRQLLPTTDENTEDASAEESSSDNHQPAEARASPIKLLQQRFTSLTPKPIPSISKSKKHELMTDDLAERAQIYKEMFGTDMPVPPIKNRHTIYPYGKGPAPVYLDEDSYVGEDEVDLDLGLTPTRQYLIRNGLALKPLSRASTPQALPSTPTDKLEVSCSPHSSLDFKVLIILQAGKTKKKDAKASSSGLSTKSFRYHKLIISASGDQRELILTNRVITEPTRGMINHYQRNPSRRPPTAQEMEDLLIEFDAREVAKAESATASSQSQDQPIEVRPETTTSDYLYIEQQPPDVESEPQNDAMSGGQRAEVTAVPEGASEVPEPQTPTPQKPQAQEPRGWFTGVSALFATPLKIFGRRSQSAEAATTTNSDSVASVSSIKHLIPQTSDFAIPPTTPTNPRRRRNLFPQSERKPSIISEPKTGPKTDRRVHFADPEVPIHLRGLLSDERKQEIWRREDDDRNLKERQNRRANMQARVENEDEHDANQYVESSRPGEKRKDRHPTEPLPENFNHGGNYSAPSPGSSDEGDTQLEVEMAEVDANRKGRPSRERGASPQVGSGLLQELEPYDHRPWRMVYAKRFKQKFGRFPVDKVESDFFHRQHADDVDRSLLPLEFLHEATAFHKAEKPWSLYPRKGHKYRGDIYASVVEAQIESGDPERIADCMSFIEANCPSTDGIRQGEFFINARSTYGLRFPDDDWRSTPKSSLVTNPDGLGASTRNNTYTGTLFSQPPDVQANLEEGKYPLAPRNSTPSRQATTTNLFSGSTSKQDIFSNQNPSQYVVEEKDLWKMSRLGLYAKIGAMTLPELQQAFNKVPVSERATVYDKLSDSLKKKVDGLFLYIPRPASLPEVQSDHDPVTTAEEDTEAPESSNSGGMIGRVSVATPPAPATSAPSGGLFGRISAPDGDTRIGTLAASVHTPEPTSEPTLAEGAYIPTPSKTFSANFYNDSESDEDETEDGNEIVQEAEVQNTRENAAGDASVLQPKTWTQTPPPKPKPSNAQLPQIPTQSSAAELAKARYEKFKPTRPSGLRNVTQMSPLHTEQEVAVVEAAKFDGIEKENRDFSQYEFDPEVIQAVMAIPEEQLIKTALPTWVYDDMEYEFDREVVEEVMRLLP